MNKLLPFLAIILVFIIYIGRLSYLQLFNLSSPDISRDTAIKAVYTYPERGYIYDRNGKLWVANQPAYDVMVIPSEVKAIDTLEFCRVLNISKEDFEKKMSRARRYSTRLPSVFISKLSREIYGMLQEKMRKYGGFYIQKSELREYMADYGANVLGYIREVSNTDLRRNKTYTAGELIGRQGVEKQYDSILRGKKGVKYIQKDRFNRDIGPYKNGIFDTLPEMGKDVHLTIDLELQKYCEALMINKRGGIVALEPKSGEILALVSAPTYNPSLLIGRERSANYKKLFDSVGKPLYDRALQAQYPPGSPFKVINALIGLQEGVINTRNRYLCVDGYKYGKKAFMRCHCGGGFRNLNTGIVRSCNAYFANTYRKILDKPKKVREGLDNWEKHVRSFGLGNYLGYDLPIGRPGHVPDSDFYNRQYGKYWYSSTTISNAIGQGEVLSTPVQLANVVAVIANRGYFYTPHVLKKIENKEIDNPKYTVRKFSTIDTEHFEPVIEGMTNVYKYGTARFVQIPGISTAGKTGTVENFTIIDGKRKQLTDHSIFVAFAPAEDPKIALAVFVENGYWGNRWAGRIAGLMIEKYLKGEVSLTQMEKFVLEGSLQEEYAKALSGKPFKINE